MFQRVNEFGAAMKQHYVFFTIEWANTSEEQAARLLADPALAFYKHYLETERRYRPHLLTEPEEKVIAEMDVTGSDSWTRFFAETMGAARYTYRGQSLSQAAVMKPLYSPDRTDRKDAADALTAGLRETARTTTFIYNTILSDKATYDRLRKYSTWVSSRNLSNEASDETVNALITAVTSRYDLVSRYYTLKRDLLGVGELFDYDRYAPLPFRAESKFSWNEAKEIVLRGYGGFDENLAEVAEMFFDKRWIDAPVRPGKRSGAFSAGVTSSVHPYILMNFTGTGRDVATLAHELGHGIHQYLSRERGTLQMHTPLTTAEMASTFGEMLVFADLISRENDPKARLAMLAGKIEDTFATIFRQTSMNRFEDAIHTERRTKGELTTERFSEHWLTTQRAMFGESVTLREDYGLWWSYIPHFLNTPGYVYAYAFGELLVLALYAKYKSEGPSFIPKYHEVLSMGGSDWPHHILRKVGVDLNDPNFWREGLGEIEKLIEQAEALAK
jgi:oligoendopeptidase F